MASVNGNSGNGDEKATTPWGRWLDKLKAPPRLFGPQAQDKVVEIQEDFPYRDLHGRYLIDAFGCVHAFYEVDAPAADVASAELLVEIQKSLSKTLGQLPDPILQIQFCYTRNGDYRDFVVRHMEFPASWEVAGEMRHIRGERLLELVKRRLITRSKTLMILTCGPQDEMVEGKSIRQQFSANKSRSGGSLPRRILRKAEFDMAVGTLQTAETVAMDSLSKVGIGLTPMGGESICSYFYRLFNPDLAIDLGLPLGFDERITPFYNTWLLSDVYLKDSCYLWGDYYHALVSIPQEPHETQPRIIEQITTMMPFSDFRITLNLRRTDKTQEIDALTLERKRAIGKIKLGSDPFAAVNKETRSKGGDGMGSMMAEHKYDIDEVNDMLVDLRANKSYLMRMQLVVHLWHRDRKELERRSELTLSRIANMNKAKGWRDAHSFRPVFINSLPAVYMPLLRTRKVRDTMAMDLIPLHKGFEGGRSPMALLHNSTGGLVAIDLFERSETPASLCFVSGATGSGKSVLVNLLIEQHLVKDPETGQSPLLLILDIGGSYKTLVEMLGGKYIPFDAQNPICINPLQVTASSRGGIVEEPDTLSRTRMLANLAAMAYSPADPGGELPTSHINLLDGILTQTFYHAQADGATAVTLSMLLKRLREFIEKDGAADLYQRLSTFTGETYRAWVDGPTQIDIQSEVVCFDLKGIDSMPVLSRVMVPMIINYIYDMVMRHKHRRKIVVMDEMWKFLLNDQMLEFVMEAYRTFRKENAAVIGISQALRDVGDNPAMARSLVQNTYIWFLLDQQKADARKYAVELLTLTDGQADILGSLEARNRMDSSGNIESFREALMIMGQGRSGHSGRIRVQLMPEEYWIFTTDPQEKLMRDRAIAQFEGDLTKAILYLAKKHPGGLHLREQELA